MFCYEYVRRHLRPNDIILRQKISTDFASTLGHFAILRGNYVIEYMPGLGRRTLLGKNYWQEVSGERVKGYWKFFRRASLNELDECFVSSKNGV